MRSGGEWFVSFGFPNQPASQPASLVFPLLIFFTHAASASSVFSCIFSLSRSLSLSLSRDALASLLIELELSRRPASPNIGYRHNLDGHSFPFSSSVPLVRQVAKAFSFLILSRQFAEKDGPAISNLACSWSQIAVGDSSFHSGAGGDTVCDGFCVSRSILISPEHGIVHLSTITDYLGSCQPVLYPNI
jgi:hypothetical protein